MNRTDNSGGDDGGGDGGQDRGCDTPDLPSGGRVKRSREMGIINRDGREFRLRGEWVFFP